MIPSIPKWLVVLGWVALPGTLALFLRLSYEWSILSWREGPQMIGFTLTHAYVLIFLVMLLSATDHKTAVLTATDMPYAGPRNAQQPQTRSHFGGSMWSSGDDCHGTSPPIGPASSSNMKAVQKAMKFNSGEGSGRA